MKHLQDNDYSYEEDYESSGDEPSVYEGCEYVKTLFDGTLSSPNWPKKYDAKEKCHWTILAPPEFHIELTFESFKLEYHKSCRMDRVEVHHDGHGFYLCGSGTPKQTFISTEPKMELFFQSDEAQNFNGFRANYKIVPNNDGLFSGGLAPRAFTVAQDDKTEENGMCGRPTVSPSKQLRILGGQPVKAGQWPWLGMLLEEDGEYIHMKCGVALICRKWALTSADCVRELKTGAQYTRRLKFGNMRWDHDRKEEVEVGVSQVIEHPYFDGGYHFDIALIQMTDRVPLTDYIMPICLKNYVTQNTGTYDCYSAGWGKNSRAESTRQAHQAKVNIINDSNCAKMYKSKYDKAEMICTGGENRPCQGDGGAPLVSFRY